MNEKHSPTPVGNLIDWVFKEFNLDAGVKSQKVFEVWDEVVGETIARKARPETIRNRVLVVKVSSSPWIQELQFMKQMIRDKLNERIGETLIDDLFFQMGTFRFEGKEPEASSPGEWRETKLPRKEMNEVEKTLKVVEDDDLKSILKRILISQKKRVRYFRER